MLRIFAAMRQAASLPSPMLDAVLGAAVRQLIVESRVESQDDIASDTARVLQHLPQEASSPVSVADHARSLGLSVIQLREIVRDATALSPKAYVVNVRINRAKALLAGSDLPVSRVAARTGYDDAGYFTRLFTRHVGTSPSRFREQYLRGHDPGSDYPTSDRRGLGPPKDLVAVRDRSP